MAEYQRLNRSAKVAYALEQVRANPVECPACQTMVDPRQLEQHPARCPGRAWGAPADGLGWLSWPKVKALGVSWGAVQWWMSRGKLRRRQVDGAWVYSRHDLLEALEASKRRRESITCRKKRAGSLKRWRKHSESNHASGDDSA